MSSQTVAAKALSFMVLTSQRISSVVLRRVCDALLFRSIEGAGFIVIDLDSQVIINPARVFSACYLAK